ncbi:1,2-phenylacetyl-CoA epoxidase subunit PaaC [Methylobacterium nodulans]|uniref:Phenylacetate-CoA oxygenase, PaaI subunit n=1 Tax=Methylobacterium nodulans (strain LMG 21967 / CNCM I-2342 / ORS 2060) TaxID=460265 RepID=B8IKF2_METNO|nr:1,2-phenylacetyl-CoA epoxidase subunit PaaC [Methylobacterium nodulans]ACL61937.1 phenylacetate-CoA oxygenase, PaaI subunit [Methylobacterium nodulans ORS 2060]
MPTTSIAVAETPLLALVLRRADDALILGHRLSEWCGHAPMLEEDIALANLALDCVGQARALYDYAAALDGRGLTEDDLAYRREAHQYRNCLLVEQPNGDFAATIVRQVLFSAFADPYWRAMTGSADPTLAAIAAKTEKETAYHLRHAGEWLIRLGDGTQESHARAQAALDDLWPYAAELFEPDPPGLPAESIAVDPAALRPAFDAALEALLGEATLERPSGRFAQSGGRAGRHSEHLGFILADLQYLQRAHPGAVW